ncbi:T6SS immunity protein Tli4 family protein [Burkholderia sp. WSM2230]|uniref:T6SS immunity protein Tli4 family protein n=1 Tax=Burkholderia sp. WSM2230 TaxID=944435 RepID=UPI001E485B00|nr:T6SS immunity protein Tli4 family protein [Burkholderia sp. WSM2230]
MSNVKTYCFGRYLVDLPADAVVSGQAYQYMFGQIDSEPTNIDQKGFSDMLARRSDSLKSTSELKGRTLKGVVSNGPAAEALITSEKIFGEDNYGFEAYWFTPHRLFTLKTQDMEQSTFQAKVLPRVKERLLPNLRARNRDDIPSQPGFCLKNGFIADDGKTPQYEEAGISFKFPQWPGVLVSVNSSTVTKLGEPKLLERMAKAPIPDAYRSLMSSIHNLRKGTRVAAGREGEEVLSTVPTDGGYRVHQFQWEAQGSKINDPLDPTLTVEFESGMTRIDGQPARPKLTDEEAVRLFDAVVNSIRLRPTGGSGKVSGIEPGPTHSLGTLARTGSVCPQSGWWTCPEANGHEIVGGTRQHFAAGTVMPQVRVASRAAFLDRVLGKQQEHAVNTTWKLVGFDKESPTDASGESAPNEG